MLREFQQEENSCGIRYLKKTIGCENLMHILFGQSIFVVTNYRPLMWTGGVRVKSQFTISEVGIDREDYQDVLKSYTE
jgi:hypothetical protein